MTILITGGAGYIGRHMVYAALERGHDVAVVDDLSTGMGSLVAPEAHFHQGHVGDRTLIRRLLHYYSVSAVIHFAGSIVVPDSVKDPLLYYANNTVASRNLIEACVTEGVKHFIFSSTAAVYGMPETNPIREDARTAPINPYGRSKLMTEWMLEDSSRAHDLRYVGLRYFNVAGGDVLGRTGQSTERATQLLKRACQAALGRIPVLDIFGTDFPTRDGTGIRDYIHVSDLVDAHALALDHLEKDGNSLVMNCGYGHGFSVREAIAPVENDVGRKRAVLESDRRPGDPPELVADSTKLKEQLAWSPERDNL